MQSTQYYYIDDLFVAVENTRQTFPRIMNLAANDNSNQNLEYCVQAHQFSLIGNVEYIEKLKKLTKLTGNAFPEQHIVCIIRQLKDGQKKRRESCSD